MSTTPEHDKIERIRRTHPGAADLLHLLLASEGWTLSNVGGTGRVEIEARRLLVELIGIDYSAYQRERLGHMGITLATLATVDQVVAMSSAAQDRAWLSLSEALEEMRAEVKSELAAASSSVALEAIVESPVAANAVRG